MEVETLGLIVGAAAAAAATLVVLVDRFYVAVPPNRALVLYGRRAVRGADDSGRVAGGARVPRILLGGGTFLAPWNTASASLSLTPLDVEATVRALHSVEGGSADGWEVTVQTQVKVPGEPRALRAAAENLLGLGDEELRAFVRRAVEGAVPAVLARIRRDAEEPDWERLATEIQAAVGPDLVTAGLLVRTLAVKELRRIVAPGRTDRTGEPRRRSNWSPPLAAAAGRPDPPDLRLVRVERGLRVIAADLARLLRDEPVRSADDGRWPDPAALGPSATAVHDSTEEGRPPAPARPPWGTAAEPEANP